MVNIELSYKKLLDALGVDLSIEELEKCLFDMGMDLDSIDGDNLRVDITPDRSDMLSLHGLARALKAYLKIKIGLPTYKITQSDVSILIDKSVDSVRPYTVAAVVKDLELNDDRIKEIIQVQEKLHQTFARNRKKGAIGIYPLEKITPPIKYVALNPNKIKFRPLECLEEMTGLEILSNHPTGKEYAHLLEGKKLFSVFMDSKNNILSMPPIINSHMTGRVTEDTRDIFIECSGHDMRALNTLLNILITMFSDMGGKIYSVELKYPEEVLITPDLTNKKIIISMEDINSVLGTNIDALKSKELLERMLYAVKVINPTSIEVIVPPFRSDIWHPIDIIDDVSRAYGLNNLEPTLKLVSTVGGLEPMTVFRNDLADILAGLGFLESLTLSLSASTDQFESMNIAPTPHIRLGTTAEKSINMLRSWLLPEVLKVLVNNRNRSYPQKVFEIGEVVIPDDSSDVLSINILKMSVVIAHSEASFMEIKQILNYLMSILNLECSLKETVHGTFIEGRTGQIFVNDEDIGIIGEIHPVVLKNINITVPIVAFEIDLSKLFKIINS